jgi:hypothetical protein
VISLTGWRRWRDTMASTFDLSDEEETRLREMFDTAVKLGIRHAYEARDGDESIGLSEILDPLGL